MIYIAYAIKNFINNKVYIGITSGNLYNRWQVHLWTAIKGDKKEMYVDMVRYGVCNYYIEELLTIKRRSAYDPGIIENKLIIKYNSISPFGYNSVNGSVINSTTKSISKRIQKIYKKGDIKISELADKMKIHPSHLSAVLNNRCSMTNNFIEKANRALGTNFKL